MTIEAFQTNRVNNSFKQLIDDLRDDCPSNFFDNNIIIHKGKEIFPYYCLIPEEKILEYKNRPVICSGNNDSYLISSCVIVNEPNELDTFKHEDPFSYVASLRYIDLGSYLLNKSYVKKLLLFKDDLHAKIKILDKIFDSKKYELLKLLNDEDLIRFLLTNPTSQYNQERYLYFFKYWFQNKKNEIKIDLERVQPYYREYLLPYFL